MITIDEHRARILAATPRMPVHTLPLAEALGHVLAESPLTRWPTPLFDNSAMDGYAVRSEDAAVGAVLRVVADLPAGSADDPPLGAGEAARIMTGAPAPTDADAIVPLEHTDLGVAIRQTPPETISILRRPEKGAHIRRQGEDAPAGSRAVDEGTLLEPWQLSAIASAGYDD